MLARTHGQPASPTILGKEIQVFVYRLQQQLNDAKQIGITSLVALSTCNRSELYGYCQNDDELRELFIKHTNGTTEIFKKHSFLKRGHEALEYLFKVAAGLHSQITGDYEILGQLKCAVAQSRKEGLIGPVMDRTINYAIQASKAIKTNTQLSNGTVSVSYAVIEWLGKIKDIHTKSVLLVGAGALSRNVIKNLQHYLKPAGITIINRTDYAATELAIQTKTTYKSYLQLKTEVANADIVIVCTNAPTYILLPHFFSKNKKQYILDLSVPENVHPAVKNIIGKTVTGVDEVSQTMQDTFAKRNTEIPKANAIIEQYLQELHSWLALYRHVPVINDIKNKLHELCTMPCCNNNDKSKMYSRVNKTVGTMVMNLRYKNEKGCQYIKAINDFLKESEMYG